MNTPKNFLPEKYSLPEKCPECWRTGRERIGCNCLNSRYTNSRYTIDSLLTLRPGWWWVT